MSKSGPSYITKNRLGTYYFQYSYIANEEVLGARVIRKLFRRSLKTKSRAEALISARYLWVVMQSIQKKYFSNPKLYGRAMELLSQYEALRLSGWEAVDEFLSKLDEDDDRLLNLGIQEQRDGSSQLSPEQLNAYEVLLSRLESTRGKLSASEVSEADNPLMSALIDKWISEKQKTLKLSSLESSRSHVTLFYKVLVEIHQGDFKVRELTFESIRRFNEILQGLPAYRSSPKFVNMTFSELLQVQSSKISSKTYHYYINTVLDFLGWLESQGYIENTRFKSILQSSKKNVAKKSTISRVPFTEADLKLIFQAPSYMDGKFKRASDYWVPLIALFTGARLGEICQLSISDLKEVDGVLCFDINEDEGDKSIKSRVGSARTIPVHKILLDLDLLGYVKHLKNKNQRKLFPLERRNQFNKFDAIQKRFANQLKAVGATGKDGSSKVFHSFRHTVRTKLVDENIDERTIDSIVGHTSAERSIGSKIYTHSKLTKQKLKAINRLEYSVDLLGIKRWDACLFRGVESGQYSEYQ